MNIPDIYDYNHADIDQDEFGQGEEIEEYEKMDIGLPSLFDSYDDDDEDED